MRIFHISTVLEGARSWLGNELRGEAVPERLRDTADRLATLIDPKQQPMSEPAKVVSLEAALEAKAAGVAHAELPQDHGPHVSAQPAGVCPFTGMRADGTLAPSPAAPAAVADTPAPPVPKARQKNKERLAGDEVVEKTSARSATRSAKKQPRSRTQATRKKA